MEFYQSVADRLISDGYLLTALELYTELCERGKTIKSLKDFFDDSSNFDQYTRRASVSPAPSVAGSQLTLDEGSLFDLTRNSEDSSMQVNVSDRVAILEFELRKANQTISSLRSELTQSMRRESNVGRSGDVTDSKINDAEEDEDEDELLGHEKRTLNYLVNEYLLRHNFKLTAITFSDENSDEDFEDWESIGINTSKPPDLGRIYRRFLTNNDSSRMVPDVVASQQMPVAISTSSRSVQVETLTDQEEVLDELNRKLEDKESELLQQKENELSAKIEAQNSAKQQQSVIEKLQRKIKDLEGVSEDGVDAEEPLQPLDARKQVFLDFLNLDVLPPTLNHLTTASDFDVVIELISCSLPEIVPHILLARRGTVLPLILTAIKHHKDAQVRDNLLNLLFNLTKKPDEEMREVIVRGFVEIAQQNRSQIEDELLPQLWQQIEHKYLERRILVAQTCMALVPYIPSSIRDSLVFSILQQLVVQDKELQVRQAACNALSVLTLYMESDSKINTTIPKILTEILRDEEMVEKVCQSLLLSFARCCEKSTLMAFCEEVLPQLSTLICLLPFVIFAVITDAPFYNETNAPATRTERIMYLLLPEFDSLVVNLQECMSSFEPWPVMIWMDTKLVDPLIDLASKTLASEHDKTLKIVAIFREITTVFGPSLLTAKLTTRLPLLKEDACSTNAASDSALVPSYFLGAKCGSNVAEVTEELHQTVLKVCAEPDGKTDGLTVTISQLLAKAGVNEESVVRDSLCEMAWSLVVHPSSIVKSFAGTVLNILATSGKICFVLPHFCD